VLTGIFVREIREGIDDTGVKAAFLKCTVELHGIMADMPRILTCIAEAQKETGAPVMVHTNAEAKTGLPTLDFLTKAGVDPTKIVIAHAGDSNDLDYLRAIADTGAWLGCDRYGIEVFNSSADRIETLLKLIELGYTDQIHLSHDGAAFYDFMAYKPAVRGPGAGLPADPQRAAAQAARARHHTGDDRPDDGRQPEALLSASPRAPAPDRASARNRRRARPAIAAAPALSSSTSPGNDPGPSSASSDAA